MSGDERRWAALLEVAGLLESAGIAATLTGPAALWAQGVPVSWNIAPFEVQWDNCAAALALLGIDAEPVRLLTPPGQRYAFERDGMGFVMLCFRNTVVAANPWRIRLDHAGASLWAESLYGYRDSYLATRADTAAISAFLRQQQREVARNNQAAWEADTYESWAARFGPPAEAAARLLADPRGRLAPFGRELEPLRGRRVAHLLGSNGLKGAAMALLGAEVTVIDSSAENARYARELAAAAGASLRYVVADALELPADELAGGYDLVLLELGVLHYFVDLAPLFAAVAGLLAPGGRFVLHEFHPVSTKLISSKGRKHKADGDYFDPALRPAPVAHSKHREGGGEPPAVLLRRWTLGEVVTAVAAAGLRVRRLEELPNTKADDRGLPKTFTLVAEKG